MPQRLVRRAGGPRAGGDLQCRGEGCVVFRVKIKETHGAERTSRGGRGSCPDRRRETKVLSSLTTAVGAVPRAGFDRRLWDVNSRWQRACGRSYALGLKPAALCDGPSVLCAPGFRLSPAPPRPLLRLSLRPRRSASIRAAALCQPLLWDLVAWPGSGAGRGEVDWITGHSGSPEKWAVRTEAQYGRWPCVRHSQPAPPSAVLRHDGASAPLRSDAAATSRPWPRSVQNAASVTGEPKLESEFR